MAQTENLTVMFTDIVGFTERTSQQSRAQNMAMLRDHNQILLPLVARFGGRRVKSMGDSLMLGFRSPTDAVRCGMAMHDALAEYNYRRNEVEQLHIRVAINVGEVRVDGSDIFGEAVNVASRVEGLTPPDQIYFTEAVYLAMNKAEVPSTFVGKHKLRGIPEPVKLFTVPPRQVKRLIAGGEDLGDAPGELPFGGMHRSAPTVGRIQQLVSVVRDMPPLQLGSWRDWLSDHPSEILSMPPSQRLTPLLGGLLVTLAVAWWTSRDLEAQMGREAPPEKPTAVATVAPKAREALEAPTGMAVAENTGDEQQLKQTEAKRWLQQAHAAFEQNRRRVAAPAYGKALDLQPGMQDDPLVATRLVACLSWASDLAIPLIKKYPSSAVISALAKRTGQARDLGARRAADLLNELGFADRIDPYFLAVTDLENAKSCEAKLRAIARIRAARDPRALPALKASLGSGIGGWFKNSCFRTEANDAIEELEKIAPTSRS